MRYIYYIIGIVIILTAAVGWTVFNKATVDISKPALVINDRIITHDELESMMKKRPHDKSKQAHLDSIIQQELLIQEAIKRSINQEEEFRQSVEDFYEQSLVKTLLDRQYDRFHPEATQQEIDRYKSLSGKKVQVVKTIYPTEQDAKADENGQTETISAPFEYLSGGVIFMLLSMEPGDVSAPRQTRHGTVVYTLEKTEPMDTPAKEDFNTDRIKSFIKDRKKEVLYNRWTDKLRENAYIWRDK
ncbi:MAG: hypothetical protein K9J83_01990 [Desulfarculaceae bacterium]|nr:hypothetical protein [Desulfarculaceae bacterium]